MTSRSLRIFLSYASEDKLDVSKYYYLLKQDGTVPWMDCFDILPGQNWDLEITKALSASDVVILLLSPRSLNKRGYLRKEISVALENLRLRMPDDIYFIVAKLEPCDVPAELGERQWADLTQPDGWANIKRALREAAKKLNLAPGHKGDQLGPFYVESMEICDKWNGYPGYEIELKYPRFSSQTNPQICDELNPIFSGLSMNELHERLMPLLPGRSASCRWRAVDGLQWPARDHMWAVPEPEG